MDVFQDKSKHLINGEFGLSLTPFDRGFAYGDGVYRTLQILNGAPVLWEQHYQKLVDDTARMSLECPAAETLLDEIATLFDFASSGVCKIVITRGESAPGYAIPQSITTSTRILVKSVLPTYPKEYFDIGIKLFLCRLRLSHQPLLAGIKHLNRLENVFARSENFNPEYQDGLLLDCQDYVTECTAANIFLRKGRLLTTPKLTECGVSGVTREFVISSAEDLGCELVERKVRLDELIQADEVVITNSLYGAFQVIALENKVWQPQGLAQKIRNLLKH